MTHPKKKKYIICPRIAMLKIGKDDARITSSAVHFSDFKRTKIVYKSH